MFLMWATWFLNYWLWRRAISQKRRKDTLHPQWTNETQSTWLKHATSCTCGNSRNMLQGEGEGRIALKIVINRSGDWSARGTFWKSLVQRMRAFNVWRYIRWSRCRLQVVVARRNGSHCACCTKSERNSLIVADQRISANQWIISDKQFNSLMSVLLWNKVRWLLWNSHPFSFKENRLQQRSFQRREIEKERYTTS